jgi:hypothetical protein
MARRQQPGPQESKTPPKLNQHQVNDGLHTLSFDTGVVIEVRHPNFDQQRRLWGEIVAKLDEMVVNQAQINLLDQRQRVDFHQVAMSRDGSVDWQSHLLSAIQPVQEALDHAPSGDDERQLDNAPGTPWPILDKTKALYGLAGILTIAIDPYTEADPVAVLLNILTAFGNAVGRGPHFCVEYTEHPLQLFVVLVGETGQGRKGVSWSTPRYVFQCIDELWTKTRVTSGLSSGEGLIYHVRDQRVEKQPIRERGHVIDYEEIIVDHGEADKRLLVIEQEFSQALKVMRREGNILSPVLRQAWDTGDLHPLTKTSPIRATGAHISIVGHITPLELLRHLGSTEQVNGFANRFIWLCVKRSKIIPNPTGVPKAVLNPLIRRLHRAIKAARRMGQMRRDDEAEAFWAEIYPELSTSKPGMLGAITARATAQVMRLACLYAALDGTCIVTCDHLQAGLAVWRYCEASARYIFGNSTGDPVADRILTALQEKGEMTRTEISDGLFGRNMPRSEIDRAVTTLTQAGLVTVEEVTTPKGGRPRSVIRLRKVQ